VGGLVLNDVNSGGTFYRANHYGVATVSRIDEIIGLFCKKAL